MHSTFDAERVGAAPASSQRATAAAWAFAAV